MGQAGFVQDLTQKLDACLLSNSTDYLQWDWEGMANAGMPYSPDRSVVSLIDHLVTGFRGVQEVQGTGQAPQEREGKRGVWCWPPSTFLGATIG